MVTAQQRITLVRSGRGGLQSGGALHQAAVDDDARGIENGFLRAHSGSAPAAYPEVHHLTSPMRKAARRAGLADYVNLWAGQAYPLTATAPAADLVRDLWAQAQAALGRVASDFPGRSPAPSARMERNDASRPVPGSADPTAGLG